MSFVTSLLQVSGLVKTFFLESPAHVTQVTGRPVCLFLKCLNAILHYFVTTLENVKHRR